MAKSKTKKKAGKSGKAIVSKQLIYVTKNAVTLMVEALRTMMDEAELAKRFRQIIEQETISPDMALQGRMMESKAGLSAQVNAALQVGHAFSVNEMIIDNDFLVAGDDFAESKGTALISNAMLTSPCLLENAGIGVKLLAENLGGDMDLAIETCASYVAAFACSNPKGKMNSTFSNVYPGLVYIEIMRGTPINHCNAFQVPVNGDSQRGIVEKTIDRFGNHLTNHYKTFDAPLHVCYVSPDHEVNVETNDVRVERIVKMRDLKPRIEELIRLYTKDGQNVFVSIHVVKNFPTSNLNRDELGAPKSCMFGSTNRVRVSSQCIKKAARSDADFSQLCSGIRTRYLHRYIGEESGDPTFVDRSIAVMKSLGFDFEGDAASGNAEEDSKAGDQT